MVPVLSLLVDPLNQGVGSGIGTGIHGHAVGQVGVCHPRHVSDGALAIATRHIVAVKVIARHEELVRQKYW